MKKSYIKLIKLKKLNKMRTERKISISELTRDSDIRNFNELNVHKELFLKELPNLDINIYGNFSNYEGKEYFNHLRLIATYKGVNITINYNWSNKNQYSFYFDRIQYKRVDTYNYSEIIKNIKVPQNMGKPNKNKILVWFEYIVQIKALCDAFEKEKDNKVNVFLEKINKYKGTEGAKIYEKHGYIDKGGLSYSYEILNDGYIKESIRVVNGSSLEDFLLLSDNKLNEIA